MTIRNLNSLFRPRSIALIGASDRPGTLGYVLARNLLAGGFGGDIAMVNPKYRSVCGRPCVADIAALATVPDLAVIATPASTIPTLISDLAGRGTKAAVIISAGFGGPDGAGLKSTILQAAKPHLMRILGPNCLGLLVPDIGVNASFAHLSPKPGSVALLAQSGAILTSALDWAAARDIGFSHLVSMGEMLDVDFGDMLDYLAEDSHTSAILLYAEAITNARKFVSAARRAARLKPVIVIKAGRHSETSKAVSSHTGVLAGSDAVYDAVFRRVGILRVDDLDQLFGVLETLAMMRPTKGDRLAILTNGGGVGILAADALVKYGGKLAPLDPATIAQLNEVLPIGWSKGNPVDIIGDADADRYRAALDILITDRNTDACLILNSPTAVTSGHAAAEAVVESLAGQRKCVFTSWIGEQTSRAARQHFAENRLPTYQTPEQAVRAFMHLVDFQHNRALLAETPPSLPDEFAPASAEARPIITKALAQGRDFLTAPESLAVLRAYGVATVVETIVRSPAEAGIAAATTAGPFALKLLSPDITHKSDVGGVVLNLQTPDAVVTAATTMLAGVRQKRPDARIEGLTLSPMIDRQNAHELIVGATVDPQFGPIILFGQGGTAVEVTADRALTLPPLNLKLAHELIAGTRVYKLLQGYRDRPPANLDQIALTILKISQIMVDFGDVVEIDVNPLLVRQDSILALDARIRVKKSDVPATFRLAIKPYPRELEERVTLPDGTTFRLRPIRPEDEPAMLTAFSLLSAEAKEQRFFRAMSKASHQMIASLTQIDYDREMALVLTSDAPTEPLQIFADVRIHMDPDRETAEYAIIVRDDVAGRGLGLLLMQRILAYAGTVGLRHIFGEVLVHNEKMLAICRQLGFRLQSDQDMPGIVRVSKDL